MTKVLDFSEAERQVRNHIWKDKRDHTMVLLKANMFRLYSK